MNYGNPGPAGTYSRDANGKMIWRRNVNDGHGGNAAQHRQEMMEIAEQVAQQKIAEALPGIQKAAYTEAYGNLIQALSFDVISSVNIDFENVASIFHDKKTQTVIADAVMDELRKQFKKYT